MPATERLLIAGTRKNGRAENLDHPGNSGQSAASAPEDKGGDEEDGADYKQYLGEIGRKTGNTAETKKCRNYRDDGEDDSPSEHDNSPVRTQSAIRPTARANEQ